MSPDNHTRTSPLEMLARPIRTGAGALGLEAHAHPFGELVLVTRGQLNCESDGAMWCVPPQTALWIPAGIAHDMHGDGPVDGFVLLVDPRGVPRHLNSTCHVTVSSLLRELVARVAVMEDGMPRTREEQRVATVLVDELARMMPDELTFAMPVDARLRTIAEALLACPADRRSPGEWALRVGMSERTLTRLLVRDTGLGFARWRQQLHLSLAIQWLAGGRSVHATAIDLGYETPSSFVTMFRKALGTSPARYIAQRRTRQSSPFLPGAQ